VNKLLKSVHIWQSYRKNKSGTFLWPTVYTEYGSVWRDFLVTYILRIDSLTVDTNEVRIAYMVNVKFNKVNQSISHQSHISHRSRTALIYIHTLSLSGACQVGLAASKSWRHNHLSKARRLYLQSPRRNLAGADRPQPFSTRFATVYRFCVTYVLLSTNVTDRQTDRRTDGRTTYNRNTELCTIVHRAVKTKPRRQYETFFTSANCTFRLTHAHY